MVRLLAVSDNHGSTDELSAIISRHQAEVDYMIHCGDSELAADADIMQPFIKVRGNCDIDKRLPEEEIKKLEQFTIYVTHGHLFNVKMSLLNIAYRSQELGANIVFFGHSHLPLAHYDGQTLFVNPGSIGAPRGGNKKTYAVIDLEAGKQITVAFIDDTGTHLENLSKSFLLT